MISCSTYLVFLIDGAHERGSRWQDLVDEDEDGFLGGKLDPLTDDIDELTYGEVGGNKVLLLVDGCNVRFLHLLADDLDTDSGVRLLKSVVEEA